MARAGALDQRTGSSGQQLYGAFGALLDLCIERVNSYLM
jgi:hypothetical protein